MFSKLPFIKSEEQVANRPKGLVLHPATIIVFLFVTTFFFVFYSDNRYGAYSLRDQFLLNYSWGLIYYWGFYFYFGRPIYFLVSHNFPLVWTYAVYHLSIATLEATFFTFIILDEPNLIRFIWYFLSTAIAIVPALFICSLYFEKDLRQIFSNEPENFPYWLPYREQVEVALNNHLPLHIKGNILRIEAMNQYVQVTTDKGGAELRMSLKTAIDFVPENLGLRLHRSIWLNLSEITSLIYVEGNPRVVIPSGDKLPVSRDKVDTIRKLLGEI